ncbi:unnamed protein product [Cuscuta campestris]|uniref:Uncharacterized protein n=1 Tax=Cuscuta campestris TaxID=132261 RepID=A0A484KUN9_9ASTE|nr:unnamed protein product [Cuscuta campestris]
MEASFSDFDLCSIIPETPDVGVKDSDPSLHAFHDGESLPPQLVALYEPLSEAAKLEFDPRFTVPPEYHAPSTKALLNIWLPLMFNQRGRDSTSEHDGGKVVTVKVSDQSPSVHWSVASIKKRPRVVCHALSLVDSDDNNEDKRAYLRAVVSRLVGFKFSSCKRFVKHPFSNPYLAMTNVHELWQRFCVRAY